MKRIVIIGATSGIGYEVAKIYRQLGWRVGVAGRRLERLEAFREQAPEQTEIQQLDVTEVEAVDKLHLLIDKLGGMDLFLLSTGVGNQNRTLNPDIELATVNTNAWSLPLTIISRNRDAGIWPLSVLSPGLKVWE